MSQSGNSIDYPRKNRSGTAERAGLKPLLFVLFFAASVTVWLVLTSGRGLISVPGLLTVTAGTIAGGWAYHRNTPPLRPFPLVCLAFFFLQQSVVSGTDVARRAFSPGPDINPGLIVYESRLERVGARVLFANMMSLLPGTLCCRLDGRLLTVHALCRNQPVRASLERLETRIHNALY